MGIKSVVRFRDELFIEPFLASAGFIARYQQDGLALRVEGESDAPLTIRRTETEFFHVGVARIVQRIDARTPQLRPELLQEPRVGKDFRPYVLRQFFKLRFELVADFDIPSHESIMACNTYGIKIMGRTQGDLRD